MIKQLLLFLLCAVLITILFFQSLIIPAYMPFVVIIVIFSSINLTKIKQIPHINVEFFIIFLIASLLFIHVLTLEHPNYAVWINQFKNDVHDITMKVAIHEVDLGCVPAKSYPSGDTWQVYLNSKNPFFNKFYLYHELIHAYLYEHNVSAYDFDYNPEFQKQFLAYSWQFNMVWVILYCINIGFLTMLFYPTFS